MCFKRPVKDIVINESDVDSWNLLWEGYANGTLEEDLLVLCDYYSGINGEGHHCFFDNNSTELPNIIFSLKRQLPDNFYDILHKAYSSYCRELFVTKKCDRADRYFYKNEQVIVDILLRNAMICNEYTK